MITEGKTTVAVAGSHGKTSISSLTAHILKSAGFPVTALIGGISKNYDSNFITSGKEEIMVVEADEFDRSFLDCIPILPSFPPWIADHLDIYGTAGEMDVSFNDFAAQIKPGGHLIIRHDLQCRCEPISTGLNYTVDEPVRCLCLQSADPKTASRSSIFIAGNSRSQGLNSRSPAGIM